MEIITIKESDFIADLLSIRKEKNFNIYYDIETYQYNEEAGREKPTDYKNMVYSVAISYFLNEQLKIVIFPNFKHLFDCFIEAYKDYKVFPTFYLIAHNSNKYDNHFLRSDLLYYYQMEYTNQFLNMADDKANLYSLKLKDLKKTDKQGIILEKRIKSRNNLEMEIFLNGIHFKTLDNFVKTHSSIKTLGIKLLRAGFLTEEELKTDFNYTKYNKPNNMTREEAEAYGYEIFNNLSESEIKYIKNDVIILALSVKHYSEIFKGFDYNKITFTSNILESYNTNPLTNFQLLNTYKIGKSVLPLHYTDFSFGKDNMYDYIKSFYNGGLNFYNDAFIGKIVDGPVFGMDINSSYPFAMYKEDIPTFYLDSEVYDKPTKVNIKDIEKEGTYTLYRLHKQDFDDYIIYKIKSRVIKQMLVKYYSKNEYININSYTIKMVENITDLEIEVLPVYSYITFECVPFGSRDKIKEYYEIKTQGQNDYILNMDNLYNIYETEEKSKYKYTQEEIDISKLNLNGLYGIPALRPYFNIFRWQGTQLNNVENGYNNNQRNVLFSVFVTSVALYNLLDPFSFLTPEEIDKNFLYCDTDSIYIKKEVVYKFPENYFDGNNLGAWDIQNECIDKFYTLNHKKYCYLEDGKIIVKCGGIPQEAFDTSIDFDRFVKEQFSHGTIINNKKSIFTSEGNISIYDSQTQLEQGLGYPTFSYNKDFLETKELIFQEVRELLQGNQEEALYIDTNIGTFSISDIYEVEHTNNKKDISYFKLRSNYIKDQLKPFLEQL